MLLLRSRFLRRTAVGLVCRRRRRSHRPGKAAKRGLHVAPRQVGVGNALTDDLLEFAYPFCIDPLAVRLPYLARYAKLVLLRDVILLDFAIDGSDHGARQLNAEDERVDEVEHGVERD